MTKSITLPSVAIPPGVYVVKVSGGLLPADAMVTTPGEVGDFVKKVIENNPGKPITIGVQPPK